MTDLLKKAHETFVKACRLIKEDDSTAYTTSFFYSDRLTVKWYESNLVQANFKLTPEELKKVVDLLK